ADASRAARASRSRLAAPARSRHQPSGTDPTTFAPSTMISGCMWGVLPHEPTACPAVLTHGALGAGGVTDFAARIEAAFRTPVAVCGVELVEARASVGGTRFRAGEESQHVLHRADPAMHEAKRGTVAVLR